MSGGEPRGNKKPDPDSKPGKKGMKKITKATTYNSQNKVDIKIMIIHTRSGMSSLETNILILEQRLQM